MKGCLGRQCRWNTTSVGLLLLASSTDVSQTSLEEATNIGEKSTNAEPDSPLTELVEGSKDEVESREESVSITSEVDKPAVTPPIEESAASRRRALREAQNAQRENYRQRQLEFQERQRKLEIEKKEKEIQRIREQHQFNFERFVRKKKTHEVSRNSPSEQLRTRPINSVADLDYLASIGAYTPMTLAELRGAEFWREDGNAAVVNGMMRAYRKNAAQIYGIKESEVTGDMIGNVASYLQEKQRVEKAYIQEIGNFARELKEWPGMGQDGFMRRKKEDLWSYYGPDGQVIRERLPSDCGVIHFSGVGEVIVHKSAIPLTRELRDAWATKRWEFLAPQDARVAVADIRRTQGTGAITQILSLVEKIINTKIEAKANSNDDYDYPFKLPYTQPYSNLVTWDYDEAAVDEYKETRFILSRLGAECHNNILDRSRLRTLTKGTFAHSFLAEVSMQSGITYKSMAELQDP